MSECITQENAMNMNNDQAIQIIKPFRDMMIDQHGCPISSTVFALDRAIEALSTQPEQIRCKDYLISRQAAIDAIRASTSKYTGFMEMEMYTDDDAVEAIKALPPTQPKIIRCKGCKYYNDYTEECDNDKGLRFLDYSNLDQMYCAWAERRTDE